MVTVIVCFRYGQIDDLLSVKDQMLWYLLRERALYKSKQATQDTHIRDLDDVAKREIQEWLKYANYGITLSSE